MDRTGWRDTVWRRHSNPRSGWSRVLILPMLLYSVYRRRPWIGAAAIAAAILNPVLFSPPETDEAWMTRVVLAERWWTEERGQGLISLSYPNVLNLLNVPLTASAFLAAYRNRPVGTVLAGAAAMLCKFWYVAALVRRHAAATDSD